MTASPQTLPSSPDEPTGAGADNARRQRLRIIVIAVVTASGILTVVGGVLNLLSH